MEAGAEEEVAVTKLAEAVVAEEVVATKLAEAGVAEEAEEAGTKLVVEEAAVAVFVEVVAGAAAEVHEKWRSSGDTTSIPAMSIFVLTCLIVLRMACLPWRPM